jgi:hypothetical protein
MSRASNPRLAPVLGFTGLYLAVATVGGLARGSRELPLYLGLMGALVPALYLVHRKYRLTSAQLWMFSIWGLLHVAGGLSPLPGTGSGDGPRPLLYSWWLIPGLLRFDQLVHA